MIPSNSMIYVQSLLRLAASYTRGMAPSVITAQGFDKRQYGSQFARQYELPEEKVRPCDTEETMRELFQRWMEAGKGRRGDRMIAHWAERLIRHRLGVPTKLTELAPQAGVPVLFAESERLGHVEGLFFAVYKEGDVCFMLGRADQP